MFKKILKKKTGNELTKKKFLLIGCFLFSLFLFLSFINASSILPDSNTDLTFKQNAFINYSFLCLNDSNAYCTSSTICQMNLYSPNGTTIVNNASMIFTTDSYDYILPTNQIGDYHGAVVCIGETNANSQFSYLVTPSGFASNMNYYLLIFLVSLGVMILGFAIKDGWVTLFGTFGLYFLSLYILFFGLVGMKDNVYTWGIGIILLGVAMYISSKIVIEMLGE